jgi:hypothetical protein
VFDNEGTLWSEKPVPIQLDFTLFRMAELAGQDPSLAERQPYRAAVERDFRWLDQAIVKQYHGDDADLELLRYLEANGFSTYIASGGDRDFMRPFAHRIYGIPPERVIGSALGLGFDDGPTKPVRIWSRVGYRPMMRFARTGGRAALRLLVLHDDADREFAYTTGDEDALDPAKTHGWTVVSMKEDWSAVFASA